MELLSKGKPGARRHPDSVIGTRPELPQCVTRRRLTYFYPLERTRFHVSLKAIPPQGLSSLDLFPSGSQAESFLCLTSETRFIRQDILWLNPSDLDKCSS